jgi:hypothetical protein
MQPTSLSSFFLGSLLLLPNAADGAAKPDADVERYHLPSSLKFRRGIEPESHPEPTDGLPTKAVRQVTVISRWRASRRQSITPLSDSAHSYPDSCALQMLDHSVLPSMCSQALPEVKL